VCPLNACFGLARCASTRGWGYITSWPRWMDIGSPDSIWLYTERTFVPSLASCSPAFVSASPTRGWHQALLAFKFWPFWPF
jgi:hypothetical protein